MKQLGQECVDLELSVAPVKKNRGIKGTKPAGLQPAGDWNDQLVHLGTFAGRDRAS